MKIQSLAVLFIIIILPISMILTVYVQNQVQTLSLQISYDSKLDNATYDALKAFQLNTVNSSTSDLSNSKIRDIEASANSFFDSIASNFNMNGYNKSILTEYVPALVYTMYDGYYIYSPYTNKLSDDEFEESSTYKNDDKITGLKPYVYYSCRYKRNTLDLVITYSLDNYISVKGIDQNGNYVNDAGYLIDGASADGTSYRNIPITKERTKETIYDGTDIKEYTYVKVNGTKYYNVNATDEWFYMLNGEKIETSTNYKNINESGILYYKEAQKFTKKVESYGIRAEDAVDENGNSLPADKLGMEKGKDIFQRNPNGSYNESDTYIEEPNSNFNQHRLAVIRYSIEKNLSIAIANYNNYTAVKTNFQMPKLQEDEWDKIINHVSIISFLQGLNIGGKVYNGYSIITNTKTEEVVSDDSIYMTTTDGTYHKPTEIDMPGTINGAVFNVDLERKSQSTNAGTIYYFPKIQIGSYTSIVNQTKVADIENSNIYDYIASKGGNLATNYFTALGRERYSMYRQDKESKERIKNLIN